MLRVSSENMIKKIYENDRKYQQNESKGGKMRKRGRNSLGMPERNKEIKNKKKTKKPMISSVLLSTTTNSLLFKKYAFYLIQKRR